MTADAQRPPAPAHPDLDTLADLHADALEDRATAQRVAAHVAGCPRCRAVLSGLDGVRADLRMLPTPPMPAGVAARLDATLADLRRGDLHSGPSSRTAPTRPGSAAAGSGPGAREADHRDADHRDASARDADGGRGRDQDAGRRLADLDAARQRRRRRLVRSLGAAAAALAVVAGGVSVATLAVTGSGDQSASDSAAAGGGEAEQRLPDRQSPGLAAAVPSYDRNTLRSSLPEIVRQAAVDVVTGERDAGPAGAMTDPARRTACVGSIQGRTGDLQAVQRIRYEGRLAYVFVFSTGGRRTAYVVTEDCGTSGALPASVLDTVS